MSNETLAERAQAGDVASRNTLWKQVCRWVNVLAGREYRRKEARAAQAGVTQGDLEQEGYFAFLAALKAYDPAGDYLFLSYLTLHVRRQVNQALGLRTKREQLDPIHGAIDLFKPTPDAEDLTLGDCIADETAQDELEAVENRWYRDSLHDAVESELAQLQPAQEAILRGRYYDGLTLHQVAQQEQIPLSRVRKEEAAAFRKLRRGKLRHFVDDRDEVAYCLGLKGTGLQRFRDTRTSATEWAAFKLMEGIRDDCKRIEQLS